MKTVLSKVVKGFGSSLGITIMGGIIAGLFGLQIEYSFYQNNEREPNRLVIVERKNITPEMINDNQVMIKDAREIKLVDDAFIFSYHKWYVRILGGVVLLFPFFYFPWSDHYKYKILGLKMEYRYAYDTVIGREMARNAWFSLFKEYLAYYFIYVAVYLTVAYFIGTILNIAVFNYSILTVERILNFLVGLF